MFNNWSKSYKEFVIVMLSSHYWGHSLLRHKKEKLKNILPVSLVKTEIDISRHSYYIVYIIYLFDMLPDTLISFITSSSIENHFLKQ